MNDAYDPFYDDIEFEFDEDDWDYFDDEDDIEDDDDYERLYDDWMGDEVDPRDLTYEQAFDDEEGWWYE